jgi:S1-C subfamily serine protease
MHGTGFVVDSNGWIMTALHVVADPVTLVKRENLSVSLFGHPRPIQAEIVSPLDDVARLRDFVILKIEKANMSALELGKDVDIEDGSPIVIVGLPLSAIFRIPIKPVPPFCLAGTIAAQTALPLGNLQFLHTVYFQGVSIKGISGAPIVSLVTGKVIGIVSIRLTGISKGLEDAKNSLTEGAPGTQASIQLGSADVGKSVAGLIEALDEQLANGLGAGTGAADAAYALKKAQRNYHKSH